MGKATNKAKRKKYLYLSLIGNLGLLFVFKYFNFFNDTIGATFDYFNILYNAPVSDLLLPIGISFYTFQTLSYSIDVYQGRKSPEKHLGIFALYVSFFPQLVAGPIERSTHLLPQFKLNHKFSYQNAADGLKLMIWGFFKKLVIADRLAILVDHVYNNPYEHNGLSLIIATIFFAFQIYCDFSGYSDIAIGAARVMGFELMNNFNRPYFSKSIAEFWKRWHISLSTWFRDYVYIPLGGNRVIKWRWYYNLLITFLVSGLWHGANWTFVIWGALHGFYLVFSIISKNIRSDINKIIGLDKKRNLLKTSQVILTFFLVCFAWIFFRANNINEAVYIIKNMFIGLENSFSVEGLKAILNLGLTLTGFSIAICSILFLVIVHFIQRKNSILELLSKKPVWVRWTVYNFIIILILIFGLFTEQSFIYFQF